MNEMSQDEVRPTVSLICLLTSRGYIKRHIEC